MIVLLPIGVVILVLTVVDLFWTITPSGQTPGLIANRVTGWTWEAAVRLHHRRPHHILLAALGIALFGGTALLWFGMLWLGWVLVFCASDGAVVSTATGASASIFDRIYFVSTLQFTTGIGDYVAGSGGWRLVTAVASLTGLGLVTLAITYLVPVIQATTQRRSLARSISHLASTPEGIVRAADTGEGSYSLSQVSPSLVEQLASVAEAHLSYPVLHYLHAATPRASLALRVAALSEAITALRRTGDAIEPLERRRLEVLQRAIDDLAETVLRRPPVDDIEVESLAPRLAEHRVGDLDDDEDDRTRRLRMAAMVHEDGWTWEDVAEAD